MLPDKNDPRWLALVTQQNEIPLSAFATKMILMRVRLLAKATEDQKKTQEAIDIAYDFFFKNQHAVKEDIKTIFG